MRKLVKANWDVANNTPSKVVHTDGNFVVSETLIPYDYEYSTVTYFIDYEENGDLLSCRNCLSLEEAKKRITEYKNRK